MGSSKFKEYKGLDLPAVNSEVLERWDAVDAFGKSISTREGHPTFVFYEGPPSANGMPGIHHVISRLRAFHRRALQGLRRYMDSRRRPQPRHARQAGRDTRHGRRHTQR